MNVPAHISDLRDWACILGLEAFTNSIKQYTKLFEVTVSDTMTIEGLYAYYVKGLIQITLGNRKDEGFV